MAASITKKPTLDTKAALDFAESKKKVEARSQKATQKADRAETTDCIESR